MNTSPAAKPQEDANEWLTGHEAPTLLTFIRRDEVRRAELSDMLTRKFREFFP